MAKRRKSGGRKSSRAVRRNPPKSLKGFTQPVMDALTGAVLAVVGMWGTKFVGKYVGDMVPQVSTDPETQKALGEFITGGAATLIAAFLAPPKIATGIGVGALTAPVITVVKMANISAINDNLSAYANRRRLAGYADPQFNPPLAGYPNDQRWAAIAGS